MSFVTTSQLNLSEGKLKLRPRECFSRDTMRRFLWFFRRVACLSLLSLSRKRSLSELTLNGLCHGEAQSDPKLGTAKRF